VPPRATHQSGPAHDTVVGPATRPRGEATGANGDHDPRHVATTARATLAVSGPVVTSPPATHNDGPVQATAYTVGP